MSLTDSKKQLGRIMEALNKYVLFDQRPNCIMFDDHLRRLEAKTARLMVCRRHFHHPSPSPAPIPNGNLYDDRVLLSSSHTFESNKTWAFNACTCSFAEMIAYTPIIADQTL